MRQVETPKRADRAIPLLQQRAGKYAINEEAIQVIAQAEGNLAVVAVCGAYRTGKSYFINRVLLGRSDGFGVGPTIEPCTRGLWMWSRLIKCQDYLGNPINLLIIDSEGLSSFQQDTNTDSQLFALTLLLSSVLIYNSVGAIEESVIDNLAVVSHLSKVLQGRAGPNDTLHMYSPDFYWILRDFSLQLLNSGGRAITENEYLQNALRVQRTSTEEKNKIRKAVTSFFRNRYCFTMVRPITNEDDLQSLEKLELEQLRPEFVEQVINIRRRILSSLKPKQLHGKKLSGQNFCEMLNIYVNTINKGLLPNIEHTWIHVCRTECQRALAESTTQFENWIQGLLSELPLSEADFEQAEKQVKKSTTHLFTHKLANNDLSQEYLKQLKKAMRSRMELLRLQNDKEVSRHCRQFLQKEFKHVASKVENGVIASLESLGKELATFGEYFRLNYPYKSLSADHILSEFLQSNLFKHAGQIALKTEATIQNLNLQLYEHRETIKSVQTENTHLREVQIANLQQTISQLTGKLELQQFQSQQFKRAIEHLRQESSGNDEKARKYESQLSELRKALHEAKLKTGAVDESRYALSQQLEMLKLQFNTAKALTDNKLKFYEELTQELAKKQKTLHAELKKIKEDAEERSKQEKSKWQRERARYENAVGELEARVQAMLLNAQRLNQEKNDIENKYLSELSEKDEKIFSLSKEIKEGKFKRATDLQETIKAIQRELALAKQDLAAQQDRSRKLRRQLETKTQALTESEERVSSIRQELQLAKQSQQQSALIEMNQKLEAELKTLKQSFEMLEKKTTIISSQYEIQTVQLSEEIRTLTESKASLLQQLKLQPAPNPESPGFHTRILTLEKNLQSASQEHQKQLTIAKEQYEQALANLKEIYLKERQNTQNTAKQQRVKLQLQIKGLQEELQSLVRRNQEIAEQYEKELKNARQSILQRSRDGETVDALMKQLKDIKQAQDNRRKEVCELVAIKQKLQSEARRDKQKVDEMKSRNFILESRMEEQKTEILQFTKDNISLRGRLDALQCELKRKKLNDQDQDYKAMDQKQELLDKLEQLRFRHQRTCDEHLQIRSALEKELALANQKNQFNAKKLEDVRIELESTSLRMEQAIRTQRNQGLLDLKEKLQQKSNELESMEKKYQKVRKSLQDLQAGYLRQVNSLESEKTKLQQLLNAATRRNEQLMAFHQQQSIYSTSRMSCLEEKLYLTSDMQGLECDRLRRDNEQLRLELEQLLQRNAVSMLPQGSSDPALLRTIESLQKDLDQSLRDRKALESEFDKQIYQERQEKKKFKEDIVALQTKIRALQRGERRSKADRMSQAMLLEQVQMLKRERQQYAANCKKDYQQLAQLMSTKVEDLQNKLQTEQITAKKLKMQLDKETACFNLSKENMQDKLNQMTMANELLTKELETRRTLATGMSPRASKYKFKLEDLPS